jgi:hypothetical protein
MILYVEKIHAIEFQWLVMISLYDPKMHHMLGILGENYFMIQTLIFAIQYEHSF